MKRILVDMSATLIHHGHIRLLQKASQLGNVIVALTTDDEILNSKGYHPELCYNERKEILMAIQYVDEVIPSQWKIDEAYLDKHNIDLLVHGADNSNEVSCDRLVIFDRTDGVSSTDLRYRAMKALYEKHANS